MRTAADAAARRDLRVVSDINYGKLVGASHPSSGRPRGAVVSALRMFHAARRADVILTNEGKQTPVGLVVLALLLFLTRQRKLVLSEFLPGTRAGARGRAVTLAYRMLLPRVLLSAQVMTAWERDDYAWRYRIPAKRLSLIPFYYFDDRIVDAPKEWDSCERTGMLSTGKNSCDWATVISAADGRAWPLTIVCRGSEYERFKKPAEDAGLSIRSDVPRVEHDALLASSSLLLVSLLERSVSAGHVRLMTAATFGTPVVASAVKGIRGYEELVCALVPPGDPIALRQTVEALTSDEKQLRASMKRVRDFAKTRPYSVYAQEIVSFVHAAAELRN